MRLSLHRAIVTFAVSTLLFVPVFRAQQTTTSVPQVALSEPSSLVPTQYTRPGGTLGDIACDRNSAIYIQPQFVAGADTNPQATNEIVRINSDGSINKFSASDSNAPDHATYVVGHAVDRDGRVFLLTMRPGPGNQLTILQLAADSSYVSKIDLDRELRPTVFAVLPSGDFLVGGTTVLAKQDKQPGKSVLWLFGSDGAFHREFFSATNPKNAGDKSNNAEVPSSHDLVGLRIGDDDNIYVLHPGSPAKVDVYDQSGARLRSLRLESPSQTRFGGFFAVNGGRIVAGYASTEKKVGPPSTQRTFRTFDAETGLPQIDFVSTFAATPACVDNNDLIFLVNGKDGSLSLYRASLR